MFVTKVGTRPVQYKHGLRVNRSFLGASRIVPIGIENIVACRCSRIDNMLCTDETFSIEHPGFL